MQPSNQETGNHLIERLRSETMPAHEQLDALIMSHDPFGSRENYVPFLTMQYLFQRDLESIYQDDRLLQFFPGLPLRSRFKLVEQDMVDLGIQLPAQELHETSPTQLTIAESLGWLFVSEGSRLGAASLSRRAVSLGLSESFGARHLAPPAEGPAKDWRDFVAVVSQLPLSSEEQNLAAAGAVAAFQHVLALAKEQQWSNAEAPVHV